MKYRGIIFDLDGTLIDTAPGIISSYRHTLEALGIPAEPEQVMRGYIGSSPKKFL